MRNGKEWQVVARNGQKGTGLVWASSIRASFILGDFHSPFELHTERLTNMSSCEQFDDSVDLFLGNYSNQDLCANVSYAGGTKFTEVSQACLPVVDLMEVNFDESLDSFFADECSKIVEFDLKWKTLNSLKMKVQHIFLEVEDGELWKNSALFSEYLLSNWEVFEEVLMLVRLTQPTSGLGGKADGSLPQAINSAFATFNVPMDGSCFYSSLSMILFDTTDYRLLLRVCALYSVVLKADQLKHFDRKSTGEPVRGSWFQYYIVKAMGIVNSETKKMFKDLDNWVDNVLVLATVYAMRRSLFIRRPFDLKEDLLSEIDLAQVCIKAGGTLIEHIRGSQNADNKEGLLVFLSGGHYQALLERNDGTVSINVTPNRCTI